MHRTQHPLIHPAFVTPKRNRSPAESERRANRTISSAPTASVFSKNGCVTLRTTVEITRMKWDAPRTVPVPTSSSAPTTSASPSSTAVTGTTTVSTTLMNRAVTPGSALLMR